MAQLVNGQIKLDNGQTKTPVEGEWYDARHYLNGQLLAVNEYEPGKQVSPEVRSQSASQQGVSLQQFDQYLTNVGAENLSAPITPAYTTGTNEYSVNNIQGAVNTANKELQDILAKQQKAQQEQLAAAKLQQNEGLTGLKTTTEGIRKDIETFSEPITTSMLTDYEEYRKTTYRLEGLLTEGQQYIKQMKETTGLASVRNPRTNKAIEDVAAEAGVLQAKLSALQGSVSMAESIITNKMGEIMTARQEELTYYKTIIQLSENNIVRLDNDQKRIAQTEIDTANKFLQNSLDISKLIQSYMADPAKAQLMDGVRLNMSIEEINSTVSNNLYYKEVKDLTNEITMEGGTPISNPSTVSSDQLKSFTDSRGQVHYFKIAKSGSGIITSDQYLKSLNSNTNTSGATVNSSVPSFTPQGGLGYIWTDPKTGITWQYTNSGWKKVGG